MKENGKKGVMNSCIPESVIIDWMCRKRRADASPATYPRIRDYERDRKRQGMEQWVQGYDGSVGK